MPAFAYPAARAIFKRGFAHLRAEVRVLGHNRRRRFLDHFLMPPLNRAFALAEVNHVTVMIAQHLDFDVARLDNEFFEIHLIAAECMQRLARAISNGGFEILLTIHSPHPLAAPAGRRFEQHRITQPARRLLGVF